MKVTYTGGQAELTPAQRRKLDVKFAKLGKLMDRKEERQAHVVFTSERRTQKAEITVHYYDHPLVGISSAADGFSAITSALEKLEKQLVRQREKWRDKKRGPSKSLKAKSPAALEPAAESAPASEPEKRVFRINHHARRKPMTLDEAVLEMERDRDYLVYRDADSGRVSVLMRRRDGHFDLVEA